MIVDEEKAPQPAALQRKVAEVVLYDPTPCTTAGQNASTLLSAALQNSLTAGLYHCKKIYEFVVSHRCAAQLYGMQTLIGEFVGPVHF